MLLWPVACCIDDTRLNAIHVPTMLNLGIARARGYIGISKA